MPHGCVRLLRLDHSDKLSGLDVVIQDDGGAPVPVDGWPQPEPETYREVVAKLLALAQEAGTVEARLQFALLAALYETLETHAARRADSPLPPRLIPDE